MKAQHNWILKFMLASVTFFMLAAVVYPLLLAQPVAAQTSWSIVVDNSINEGAIKGEVSGIQTGTDLVRGNIVVTNNKALWWKVYVTISANVTFDVSNLFTDAKGRYFLLAPKGNSATSAVPPLPSSVTFHQTGAAVFFDADRTIESGFQALILQVADIFLIASTGSGVPSSLVGLTLQTLQAPAFATAANALAQDPPDLLAAAGAISGIASDTVALSQLQDLLTQLGVNMTTDQIADAFWIMRIFRLLVTIYDVFTSPFADNVVFQAIGEEKPLIAAITASPTSGSAPLAVSFDASNSYAPQYPIQSYGWNFGDNGTATGVTTTYIYSRSGRYSVTLTVTDSQGRQSTAKRSILVSQERIQVAAGTERFGLTFEAGSFPNVLSYSWDFGDSGRTEGRAVNHTYAGAGEYVVVLSLGLDTGDATQNWVPWVAWDVIKVKLVLDSSLAGWSFSVDKYDTAPQTVALNGIIIEDADEVWTNTLASSPGLSEMARNVAPRIVAEYSDSLFEFGLQGSAGLDQVAGVMSPRVAVEYGDSIFELGLQSSEGLNQIVGMVPARIIVEYTDSIFKPGLEVSGNLSQVASAVIPRIMMEYADSMFSTSLERPLFLGPPVMPGDANGDGVVNAIDITKVERIIAGLDSPTLGADANQDGLINAIDITKVERLIAGLG